MPVRPAPVDVVEFSRRTWIAKGFEPAASGMAVYTSLLRAHQLLNAQVNEVMRTFDLSFARYEVLAWLAWDSEEGSNPLSLITEVLRIPPATVTNLVDRLEDDGLVRRRPHPTDARTTLAEITPAGRAMVEKVTHDLNTNVYEAMPMSEDDREQIVRLLTDLRARGGEFDEAASAAYLAEGRSAAEGLELAQRLKSRAAAPSKKRQP